MAIQTAVCFIALGTGMIILAWTNERKLIGNAPYWLSALVFTLCMTITLATWLAISSALTSGETQGKLYGIIAEWFPLVGTIVASLLSLLVQSYQIARHLAGEMKQIKRGCSLTARSAKPSPLISPAPLTEAPLWLW